MRRVKSKDTKPELVIRRFLKNEGIKFKTYAKLPGSPDITIKEGKIAIRVMGCFWHRHSCKNGDRLPKSNVAYWMAKIARKIARDKKNKKDLKRLDWNIVDIWECQLKKPNWRRKIMAAVHDDEGKRTM